MKKWFENYKIKEGKKVEVTGFDGKEEAKKYIMNSIKIYKEKYQ